MAAITSHAKVNPAANGFWFDSEIKFKCMTGMTSHANANPAAYGFWVNSDIKFKYMTAMASQNANSACGF